MLITQRTLIASVIWETESGSKVTAADPTCRGNDVTVEQATGVPSRKLSHTGKLAASNSVGTIIPAALEINPSRSA